MTRLRELDLCGTNVGDAGLQHLRGLTQIQVIDLDRTRVTDAGLRHLNGLMQLRCLRLRDTTVSGAGLEHLKGLRQLQVLTLDRTKVTDAGLRHLKGWTQLRFLDLNDTTVSDAGLEHLRGSTQLESLDSQRHQGHGRGHEETSAGTTEVPDPSLECPIELACPPGIASRRIGRRCRLLALEGFLLLSAWFRWFPFDQHKGYAVLITVASVGVAFLLMLLWFLAALVFGWRFQFSILSLLLLVVVVAIPCSWLATEMKAAREQREAVEAIAKAGGSVCYDYATRSGPAMSIPGRSRQAAVAAQTAGRRPALCT